LSRSGALVAKGLLPKKQADVMDLCCEKFIKDLNYLNVQVNDLTIDTIRQEFTDLETCGKLPVLQICPARSDN
jgi:hypothetical protein